MVWLTRKRDARLSATRDECATTSPSDDAPPAMSGLLPGDRTRLTAEGAPADEIDWIDTWLRARPGRSLEALTEQESRLLAELRRYLDVIDDTFSCTTFGAEQEKRLIETRKTTITMMSQIDRDVLVHGLEAVAATRHMRPAYKNIATGLIRIALQPGRHER